MSIEENKAIVRWYIEELNRHEDEILSAHKSQVAYGIDH
jgi:hypothetical protein